MLQGLIYKQEGKVYSLKKSGKKKKKSRRIKTIKNIRASKHKSEKR